MSQRKSSQSKVARLQAGPGGEAIEVFRLRIGGAVTFGRMGKVVQVSRVRPHRPHVLGAMLMPFTEVASQGSGPSYVALGFTSSRWSPSLPFNRVLMS